MTRSTSELVGQLLYSRGRLGYQWQGQYQAPCTFRSGQEYRYPADPRLPHPIRQTFSFLVLRALPAYDILMTLSSICASIAQWLVTLILVWLCKSIEGSILGCNICFYFQPCGDAAVLISLRQHVKLVVPMELTCQEKLFCSSFVGYNKTILGHEA